MGEKGSVMETELDPMLLPIHGSRSVVAIPDEDHAPVFSRSQRFRQRFVACIIEELDYRQSFLFIPVFIGAGAAFWFSLSVDPSLIMLALIGVCVLPAAVVLRHRQSLASSLLAAASLMLVGMLLSAWETHRADTIILDTAVTTTIVGKVERREVDARGYWRYIVALKSTANPVLARPPNRVSLLSRSRHEPIAIGGMLSGKARLSPPSGPALAGLNDFAFGAFFNGVGATGFFYSPPQNLPSESGDEAVVTWLERADAWLYRLRTAIADRIRSIIGGDAGAFAASIVTDERRAISGETMEALRVSGLAHIVAISGLNMALASGIFFVGMRLAFSLFPGFSQRWPVKKISAFAALLMTLAYYLISGFAVSAERAWLMMSIMLIAVLVDRPSISLRNVALAAIIIIVLSPHEVMGPSFQMSFAATLALVSGFAFWTRWRGNRERLFISRPPLWLVAAFKTGTIIGGIVITSLIGGISTTIYSVEHFHRVTTYGLAANLAATPVMSIIVMPFALIAMLLMPFGLDAPFLKVMGYGMALVIDIAKTVADWGGDATIGRQSQWFLAISTAGFLLLTLLRSRLALLGVPLILAGLAMVFTEQLRPKPDLLIFEDGALVALVTADAVATTKSRATGFVYEQWERALPLPERHVPPITRDKPDDDAEQTMSTQRSYVLTDRQRKEARRQMLSAFEKDNIFTCQKNAWCAARHESGVKIAVLSNSAFAGTACDVADIAVSSRFVPFSHCKSGAILITSNTLRRTGSLELWLNANGSPVGRAKAAMDGAGRPWSLHRSYDWRAKSFDNSLPPHIENMLAAGG